MTIKEIEARAGMTRANIRYYETQGLLAPERRENGYRDYGEADLSALEKIKLLRVLGVPLEEVKALQEGREDLSAVLDRRAAALEGAAAQSARAGAVCRAMRQAGAAYDTLDARHWLGEMEAAPPAEIPVPGTDAVPRVRSPWRRYFARSLDLTLCNMLWGAILSLMNVNILQQDTVLTLIIAYLAVGTMLLLEPLLLSRFGTTPGKWILGLSVTDAEGGHLTYGGAFSRTWTALWRGMGLDIPFYNLFRQWKSYRACRAGEALDWEYDSVLVLRDEKPWRAAAYVAARAAALGLTLLTVAAMQMPLHRGDISVAEFCENYNRLADYYGVENGHHLDEEGRWVEDVTYPASYSGMSLPKYTFTEVDGVMTGMRFSYGKSGSTAFWNGGYQEEMALLVLSYVKAQSGSGLLNNAADRMVRTIADRPYESFQLSGYGVNVTCEIAYSGYVDVPMMGMQPDGGEEEPHVSFSFSMEKS